MACQYLWNLLTDTAKNTLELENEDFRYFCTDGSWDDDGPTLFRAIFDQANPDTRIGVSDIKLSLSKYDLASYKHGVKDMIGAMQCDYQEIIDSNNTHEDYLLNIFQALLTTTNPDIKMEIKQSLRQWEKDSSITSSELIAYAKQNLRNMQKSGAWGQIDPKDAQMIALTTKIDTLEKAIEKKINSSNYFKQNTKIFV